MRLVCYAVGHGKSLAQSMDDTMRHQHLPRRYESVSCQRVAFFIKLDFASPLKVAVFVGFLNNSSLDDVIAVEILTRFENLNAGPLWKEFLNL